MPNKFLVRNPYLAEYTYDIIYNATPEQKKKLSRPFLLMCNSNAKARRFSELATLDERARLFNELGMDNAIVFFQDKLGSINKLKEILKKYEDDKQAGASKEIAGLKVFVSSDRNVTWLLNQMSNSIHHKSYFQNVQYNKIGFHIRGWGKKINTFEHLDGIACLDNYELVTNTALASLIEADFSESNWGIKALDLKVLMFLFRYKNTAVPKEQLKEYFGLGVRSTMKVTTSIRALFGAGHIQRHPDTTLYKYTITSSGIKIVNDFMERVIKQNNL